MPGGLFAAVILLAFSSLADCQTTHMVTVGVEGSFYVPNKIIADINDTVSFIFGGDIHTVTQGVFNSPCVQLQGGFSSGLAGRGPDFSGPTVAWNIRITNVSAPIWFFCEATRPTSHCATGMVGVINPVSLDQFDDFQARAKNVTSQPQITPAVTLTGVGAVATTPPTAINSTILPPPVSTTSTSTSDTSASTSSAAPGATSLPAVHTHTTTIIAAAVGGGVGGLILLIALILCYKRYKKSRPSSSQFFQYNAAARSPRPSDVFAPPKGHNHTPQASFTFSPPPAQYSTTTEVTSDRGPASITQRPSANQLTPVRLGATHDIGRQSSFASTTLSPGTATTTSPQGQDSNMDIGVLAREVAAVLMRSPDAAAHSSGAGSVREEVGSRRQRGQDVKRVFGDPRYPADGLVSRESVSPAPPGYRVSGGDVHSGTPWH